MWLTAILGSASAFIESTLAQIYKRKAQDGTCYGGPAYYIQAALKKRWLGAVFAVFLILTYMVGFNMVASFNIADSFRAYGFFNETTTPVRSSASSWQSSSVSVSSAEARRSQRSQAFWFR